MKNKITVFGSKGIIFFCAIALAVVGGLAFVGCDANGDDDTKPSGGPSGPVKIDSTAAWDAAIAQIVANGPDEVTTVIKSYDFEITGDFGVAGRTEPIAVPRIKITLTGSGKMHLTSPGSMFVLGKASVLGEIDIDQQTLIIDGPTLEGLTNGQNGAAEDNDTAVVVISEDSSLELKNGSIKGNTNGASNGYGGGVALKAGSEEFTMSGGTISGNKATSGGGVSVGEFTGGFTMSGGTISGNEATASGGGVYSHYLSEFTMSGGTISNNTATNGGGGGVLGTITMSGGTIKGNKAVLSDAYLASPYYGGGGVSGEITKTGGTITGSDETEAADRNIVTNESSTPQATFGHAVYYVSSSNKIYYRDISLAPAENISSSTLPVNVGDTSGNWTRKF